MLRVQAPHKRVLPRRNASKHVGARRLGVPAFAHIRQPGKQRHAAVLPQPNPKDRTLARESAHWPTQSYGSAPHPRSSFHFCTPQTSGGSRGPFRILQTESQVVSKKLQTFIKVLWFWGPGQHICSFALQPASTPRPPRGSKK